MIYRMAKEDKYTWKGTFLTMREILKMEERTAWEYTTGIKSSTILGLSKTTRSTGLGIMWQRNMIMKVIFAMATNMARAGSKT